MPLSNADMMNLIDAEVMARQNVQAARQAFNLAHAQIEAVKQAITDKKQLLEQAEAALKIAKQATDDGIKERARS
jgi:hypothetical protein